MRRRLVSLALIAVATAGGIVGFACGFDGLATKEPPEALPDTSPQTDAATIPRVDAPVGTGPDGGGMDADASRECPMGHGMMVLVDAGGLAFCIDSTEVTNAEYNKFISAADGSVTSLLDGGQPDGCAANTTFGDTTRPEAGAFPVGNVDWCDAYAFCRWAGKRLCGKTAGGDAATGEWFAACTNGGKQGFPYGTTYDASACNELSASTSPAGSRPACQGGVPGVFDMNGNVTELTDLCRASTCVAMGGFYYGGPASCSTVHEYTRTTRDTAIGFRCCADAP